MGGWWGWGGWEVRRLGGKGEGIGKFACSTTPKSVAFLLRHSAPNSDPPPCPENRGRS